MEAPTSMADTGESVGPDRRQPEMAVVVVNHDAGDLLATFVASLRAENDGRPTVDEVIVVDNASGDGSTDRVAGDPLVRVVRTGANLGYGAGANRGVALTDAEFVLVSNPDVAIHPGALARLRQAMVDDPTVAIAGPAIYAEDGSLYPSARLFPSAALALAHALVGVVAPRNRFSVRYRMEHLDRSTTVAVDWVSGACFLARRRALKELAGFDESYFMYVEDLDLCWRAHRAGWAVAYVPSAAVTHLQGTSTARHPYRMLLAHHRSTLHFASRRTEGWRRTALPGVALVLGTRLVMAWTRQALGTLHKTARQGE
jgi:N-acetylglucosaminyl-diphospho-decaprenol L-rhamnosyltransferase